MEIFSQIAIVIIIATIGGYLARIFRQPLIPAYVITGIVMGPIMGLVTNTDVIETLSLAGIAFLLFLVGLELRFNKLKDIGKVAIFGGIVQILLIFSIGFFLGRVFGFIDIEAAYIGLILAFSSTMVVIKLLSDKRELTTLHGKIIIGILIVQDIIAIFSLTVLSSLNSLSFIIFLESFVQASALLVLAFIASRFIFPSIFKFAAEMQELLFILALSVCFFFSLLFSYVGFSIAIGAFVGGLSLANLPYNIEIIARVKSLRDFFSTIFFVSLGLTLVWDHILSLILPIVVFVFVVILLKPLIMMVLGGFFGYTKRTSFLSALSLAQTSEFSLIIVAHGLILGQVSQDIFTIAIVLAMVTITITSYFMKFEEFFYRKVERYIGVFDFMNKGSHLEYMPEVEKNYEVVLIGYDRIGYNIFKSLSISKKHFVIIDFNPDIIKRLIARKVPCIYGDIGDPEIIERVNLKKVDLIVSTVPTYEDNLLIIKKTKHVNQKAAIFVTADTIEQALDLYKAGADYVILPHFLGGERVSSLIEETKGNLKTIIRHKQDHMVDLETRREMRHQHPKKMS